MSFGISNKKSAYDALQATLTDLEIRSVVEETVKSMLVDVELAASLREECQRQDQMAHLERQVLAAQYALQESRLLQHDEKEERTELANALVLELWHVSQELGVLKRWKKAQLQDTTEVLQERDELVAKLLQATEEIQQLKTDSTTTTATAQTTTRSVPVGDAAAVAPSLSKDEDQSSEKVSVIASATVDEESSAKPATAEESTAIDKDEGKAQPADSVEPQFDAAPAVALVIMEGEEEPLLETFEESILLQVFSFLDALEIVNLAQVNIALYSRVDSLFGIGEDTTPVPTEISTPAQPPPQQAQQQQQATIVQLPPPRQPAAKKPATEPKQPPAGRGGLISLFQTSKAQASGAAATTGAKQHKLSPPRASSSNNSRSTPLSAAMANSMAEKLNDKEINAIISMTEKLNQRNKEVDQLTLQNVELRGKLDGTEAIKNFLVTKVREMEQAMVTKRDLEAKTAQQIASDQEVISFLDSRVRELERSESSLAGQYKSATDQLVQLELDKDKKITVLSDMLQYERERQAEQERDYKATKKVLVKEVKTCRATIMALQAERDGLQQQNERLKRAVMNTASSSSNAMNGGSSSPPHHHHPSTSFY